MGRGENVPPSITHPVHGRTPLHARRVVRAVPVLVRGAEDNVAEKGKTCRTGSGRKGKPKCVCVCVCSYTKERTEGNGGESSRPPRAWRFAEAEKKSVLRRLVVGEAQLFQGHRPQPAFEHKYARVHQPGRVRGGVGEGGGEFEGSGLGAPVPTTHVCPNAKPRCGLDSVMSVCSLGRYDAIAGCTRAARMTMPLWEWGGVSGWRGTKSGGREPVRARCRLGTARTRWSVQ